MGSSELLVFRIYSWMFESIIDSELLGASIVKLYLFFNFDFHKQMITSFFTSCSVFKFPLIDGQTEWNGVVGS